MDLNGSCWQTTGTNGKNINSKPAGWFNLLLLSTWKEDLIVWLRYGYKRTSQERENEQRSFNIKKVLMNHHETR